METLPLLKTLSEAPGPAGREQSTRKIIETYWDNLSDKIHVDAMGNLIALKYGNATAPRPALMIAAHMDEIGLIVTGIEREFLRIHSLGGIDRRVLLGLEVTVHGRRDLPGLIGTRPPHVLPTKERRKVVEWNQMFVDVGLSAGEVKKFVRVGDHITIHRELVELKEDLVAGKAMDNRASVAALTLALAELQSRNHAWDIYAVATVQEEVGLKGAITSAFGINPDIALAIDVTFGKQYNDSSDGTFEMNKGPTIGIGPNLHPQIVTRMKKAADNQEIPYLLEPLSGSSGTDAWGIQVAREGIPCGLLSIPVRYMHQPVETVSLRDIERTGRLTANFAAELEVDFRPRWEDEA